MDELIIKLEEVKYAIQHLEEMAPTEHNCNHILASIQRLNYVAERLRTMDVGKQEMDVNQE